MARYLIDMDEPKYCDHCLFFNRDGRCNISNARVESSPPEYYHSVPSDCPLKPVEWQLEYVPQSLYENSEEWVDDADVFDNLEQAVGHCVLEMGKLNFMIRKGMRVMEVVTPPRDQLGKVVWETGK